MLAVLSAIVFAVGSIGTYNSLSDEQAVAAVDNDPAVAQVQVVEPHYPGELGW